MNGAEQVSFVENDYSFSTIRDNDLLEMHEAAQDVLFWQSVLSKTGDGVISEFLRGIDEVDHDRFYPEETVEDKESGCQYYFHAHSDRPEEYGHFHTYVMEQGLPEEVRAVAPSTEGNPKDSFRTHCHLVAISIASDGRPTSLFTLNHWAAHEAKYGLDDLERILRCFDITHAYPSYPVNRWISGLLKMYRPRIIDLFVQREKVLSQTQSGHHEIQDCSRAELDITSKFDIEIEAFALGIQKEVISRSI